MRALAILLIGGMVAAQAAQTAADHVYSEAQARHGAAVYAARCASCHADDLSGIAQSPPLTGPEFLAEWADRSLNDLFERIRVSMPADSPGTLDRGETADLVAFLLKANNFPAGDADLPDAADALKQIGFKGPYNPLANGQHRPAEGSRSARQPARDDAGTAAAAHVAHAAAVEHARTVRRDADAGAGAAQVPR